MMTMDKTNRIDMLHGSPLRAMIAFALPLIATGMLQQSFNSVDIAVAGRFAGHGALAAVGSNGPVIGLIINLFVGMAIGVNVVIANYIGQRNHAGVTRAVGTSAYLSVICGIIMLAISQLVARPILTILDTPAEVLDQAVEYLRIMGIGMPFMLMYNFGSAVLRSVGDTRRPFYILVATGFLNIGLNLLFVIGMGMGVAGVAWGTVIANVVNAAAIGYILACKGGEVALLTTHIRPYRQELRKIFAIGLPAGLQSTVFSFSNVFILSAINSFGAIAAAGSAAAIIFEFYNYHIISAFAQTATTFTGQNFGAGQNERIRRIFLYSLGMAFAGSLAFAAVILWKDSMFMSLFTGDAEVIGFGCERIAVVLLFQFIASYYEIAGGVLRGTGHSMTPAIITITGTCVLRLFWVGLFPAGASFGSLLLVYPVSWTLTDIMMWVAMRRVTSRLPGWDGTQKEAETAAA